MTVTDKKLTARSAEEENLFIFCKQMLKTRVFQGCYQERRYVDNLRGYRDLVVLDNSEAELKGDLKYIRNKVVNFYKDPYLWIGITLPETIGTPAGICIWSELEDTAFGNYWFQIKSIRFLANEFIVKIKPIREITTSSTANPDIGNQNQHNDQSNEGITTENIINLLLEWRNAISTSLMAFLSTEINKENIFGALRFTSLLLLSLMTGSLQLLKFIGEFSIRFLIELRMLLHVGMPIILKIIDLFSKVVGGFFILLAMIWRDVICAFRGQGNNNYTKRLPPSPQPNYQAIRDSPYYANRNRVF